MKKLLKKSNKNLTVSDAKRQISKSRDKEPIQNRELKLDNILDKTFKYAKEIAKKFYFQQWVTNPPKCPAFEGDVVHITQEGWEHITHDESKTKTDILGRLFVLERAKILLEKIDTFSDKENRNRKEYWIFNDVIRGIKLRVVVRSIEGVPKHFLTAIKKGTIEDEVK